MVQPYRLALQAYRVTRLRSTVRQAAIGMDHQTIDLPEQGWCGRVCRGTVRKAETPSIEVASFGHEVRINSYCSVSRSRAMAHVGDVLHNKTSGECMEMEARGRQILS